GRCCPLTVPTAYARGGGDCQTTVIWLTLRRAVARIVLLSAKETTRGAGYAEGHDPLSGPVGGRDRSVVRVGPRPRRRARGPGHVPGAHRTQRGPAGRDGAPDPPRCSIGDDRDRRRRPFEPVRRGGAPLSPRRA